MRWTAALVAGALLLGCGGDPPCAGGGCPERTVCELDGTCRVLAQDTAEASGTSMVAAVDWGVVLRHRLRTEAPEHDVLPIGGADGAVAYLAFGPIPQGRELVRAVLRMEVDGSTRRGIRGLRVWRTRAFDGAGLSSGFRPRHRRFDVATRAFDARPSSAVHVEVTELVRGARRDREDRLYLELRLDRRGARDELRVASPASLELPRRPSLALLLR